MDAPQHAADSVFQTLALQILDGTIPARSKLPAERILAERFGTSRIIVRQAVHKLADLGLLEVRQGVGTRVGDPAAADIRVLEVIYGAGVEHPLGEELSGHRFEASYLHVVGILDCAYRRASMEDRAALHAVVHAVPLGADDQAIQAMIDVFWHAVARMGGNRIHEMEMAWWQRIGGANAKAHVDTPIEDKRQFYRTLSKQLVLGQDPIPFYLAEMRPLLNILR